ncbi:MAG TPA: hypothetical protein VII11_06845, partial [Bacteroidota bacterium]
HPCKNYKRENREGAKDAKQSIGSEAPRPYIFVVLYALTIHFLAQKMRKAILTLGYCVQFHRRERY